MAALCLETNYYPNNTVFKQNSRSHFAKMPMLREQHRNRHCLGDLQVSVTHPLTQGHALLKEMVGVPVNYLNWLFLCQIHANESVSIKYVSCTNILYRTGSEKNVTHQGGPPALVMVEMNA